MLGHKYANLYVTPRPVNVVKKFWPCCKKVLPKPGVQPRTSCTCRNLNSNHYVGQCLLSSYYLLLLILLQELPWCEKSSSITQIKHTSIINSYMIKVLQNSKTYTKVTGRLTHVCKYLISDVIKQNELEVHNDMLWVLDHFNTQNIINRNGNQTLVYPQGL